MQVSEKISYFLLETEKFPFERCHENFYRCWQKNNSEEIGILLFEEGEKL